MLVGRFLSKYIQRNFGLKGYCAFGCIGVPFHELAHLIMAVLFLHKIDDVSLFRPKKGKQDGCLGYVKHSYKKTLYRTLGNFFIGAAPMLFGAIAIFFLIKFVMPDAFINVLSYATVDFNITEFLSDSLSAVKDSFSLTLFKNPFSYIVFTFIVCIGAHMNMSWADVKNATAGAIALLGGSVAIPLALNWHLNLSYETMLLVLFNSLVYYVYIILIGLIINCLLLLSFFSLALIRKKV